MNTAPGGTTRKLALLSALYFAEGLPFGFQAKALPLYLRAHDISLTAIGLVGALSAPWLAKALWAPLVDRYYWPGFGRRKSWIIPMQLLLAATCAAASLVSPDNALGLLLFLVFLMNLFAATQDIAVDGLAVDLLGEDELGPGNAVQVVGYKLGMLMSGGLLVWASSWIGWSGLFLVMAGLVAATALACAAHREAPATGLASGGGEPTWNQVLSALWSSLRLPGGMWILVVVGTYKVGETLNDAMFGLFLVDGPFTGAQVGLWLGSYGLIASLLGSVAGGLLARHRSFLSAVAIAAAVRVIPLAAQCGLAAGEPSAGVVIAVVCAEGFFGGALTTAMFAFMMSRVDRRIGATHYTLLASVEVLGKMPTRLLSGAIAERIGYLATFGVGAALSAGFLLLLLPLRREMGSGVISAIGGNDS